MADTASTFTRGTTSREEPQGLRPPKILAGGFPDRYRSLEFTTSGGGTGVGTFTCSIQVQENGIDKAGYFRVTVILSDAEYGAPNASNTTTAVTTGTELIEHTADCLIEALTDSNGVLLMTFSNGTTDTKWIAAEIAGEVFSQATAGYSITA